MLVYFLCLTLILLPGISGSPLRLVIPGEDGKLRLGGGGGGDLEGFSVRYRGTVSSSGEDSDSGVLRKESYLHNMHRDFKVSNEAFVGIM